jgi:hypothetical protein
MFFKPFVTIPVAPIITGMITHFIIIIIIIIIIMEYILNNVPMIITSVARLKQYLLAESVMKQAAFPPNHTGKNAPVLYPLCPLFLRLAFPHVYYKFLPKFH